MHGATLGFTATQPYRGFPSDKHLGTAARAPGAHPWRIFLLLHHELAGKASMHSGQEFLGWQLRRRGAGFFFDGALLRGITTLPRRWR